MVLVKLLGNTTFARYNRGILRDMTRFFKEDVIYVRTLKILRGFREARIGFNFVLFICIDR